jgi:hypothetical protein
MNSRKLLLTATILMLAVGFAADSRADISSSAVLFLRIAPGSRAAGMGESYVAIADDATATHWNPAGLGSASMSDARNETRVPETYRPLRSVAPVNRGSGRGYQAYDIWAISPLGLIRLYNGNCSTEEVFGTKTDETLARKVQTYSGVSDEQRLAQIIDRVAAANNEGPLEELQQLRDQILAAVPAGHRDLAQVTADLDSLVLAWRECRVNWSKVREAQSRLADGLKDSVLSDDEIMRVSLALERSRGRWLPEEIKIPYAALFTSEPSVLASSGNVLLVGTADGLARFNGVNWAMFSTADGLPSNKVTALRAVGRSVLVGTDSGLVVFNGLTIDPLTSDSTTSPLGTIEAVGGSAMNMLVAVIGGELYQFDGQSWRSTTTYTAVLDDTPERIADKFSISKSSVERQLYLEKYRKIFQPADTTAAVEPTGSDSTLPGVETTSVPGYDSPITPGDMLEIPMIARVKGKVNDIFVDRQNRIWLGTEYGVFWMDETGWHAPGYKTHVVAEGESFDSVKLADLNDVSEANPLEVGDTIIVSANPVAAAVNGIGSNGDVMLFATSEGLIEYRDGQWSRSSQKGASDDNVIAVTTFNEGTWVSGDTRYAGKARGRYDMILMHVAWLPELASDMYYEYLAVAGPVRGLGTLGLSFTYLTYGDIARTGESGSDALGSFTAYDMAVTGSYGTSLTNKLRGGISAKLIVSRLAPQGAGAEVGSGTSTGFAIDVGLLYHMTRRLSWGLAITNLGPKMAYIDAAQADELPRNMAFGLAYKLIQSEYSKMIFTIEANKLLVGLGDGFGEELKQIVVNTGAEFSYINLLAVRGGYIWDQEGDIKAFTLGFGLRPLDWVQADFSYIPSQGDLPLSNTLRFSLRILR